MSDQLFDNAHWAKSKPSLSILIPFKGDDPCRLLAALALEPANAEIVVLDDGSSNAALTDRVKARLSILPIAARLVTLATNEGRAKGRNRLVGHARAGSYLFLDSDMLPDSPQFLSNWVNLAQDANPPVAFGGFSLDQVDLKREQALHHAMAGHADCLPAATRRLAPEKHLFTSNLLVRRDVFETERFDEGFQGWGWEDVEWGMRVARRWPILHLDNTATHLGLDTAEVIALKYEQSAANFARVVVAHRAVVSTYPSYRVAQALKHMPLLGTWRPWLKAFALFEPAPVKTRAFAMRLYRAALYVEAV